MCGGGIPGQKPPRACSDENTREKSPCFTPPPPPPSPCSLPPPLTISTLSVLTAQSEKKAVHSGFHALLATCTAAAKDGFFGGGVARRQASQAGRTRFGSRDQQSQSAAGMHARAVHACVRACAHAVLPLGRAGGPPACACSSQCSWRKWSHAAPPRTSASARPYSRRYKASWIKYHLRSSRCGGSPAATEAAPTCEGGGKGRGDRPWGRRRPGVPLT